MWYIIEKVLQVYNFFSDLPDNKHLGTLFLHCNFYVYVFGELVHLFFSGICCEKKWNLEQVTKYTGRMGIFSGNRYEEFLVHTHITWCF